MVLCVLSVQIEEIENQYYDPYSYNGTKQSAKQEMEILSPRIELDQETIEFLEEPYMITALSLWRTKCYPSSLPLLVFGQVQTFSDVQAISK